ncbi:MAG TPA: OB-fold nucleic acid binding domain-containing protein, partial [Anaerolineae bacterium]
MRIRTFGLASIVVALAGLAVLWFFATRAPIAHLKIGDVQSTSNYAYAQISGTVTRGPNYNAASQSLTFWVRDETGEIMVAAFRSPVQELIAANKIPVPGDNVSVQGTLRVREAVPSLSLDSASAITLVRATDQAARRDLASITAADALHGVTVRGVVRAIRTPYEGLKLISLRDATGPIDVAISADTEALLGAAPQVAVGQAVQVIGTVTLYDSTPQITLNRGADLSLLNEPIETAKAAALNDLAESDAGRWVRISGTVEKVAPFSAGTRVTLSDNGQRLTVLFWQDLWTTLSIATQIQPGAQLSVQGEVSVYRGQIEIAPEIDQDVALIVAPIKTAALSTATPSSSVATPSPTATPSTSTPASTPEPTSTPAAATTTP